MAKKTTLSGVTDVLATVNAALSLWQAVYAQFHKARPEATTEEFNALLLEDAKAVRQYSTDWLTAHGWTKDAEGRWVPPAAPRAPMPA